VKVSWGQSNNILGSGILKYVGNFDLTACEGKFVSASRFPGLSIKRSVSHRWDKLGVHKIFHILWKRSHGFGTFHQHDLLASSEVC
jgi:hypothetical protein